jgi:hypothetical protein
MKSLLSRIVSELSLRNPDVSPEQMVHALFHSLETEIVPSAITAMVIPPQPSKMQLLLETKREERRRKKYRMHRLEHRQELIQYLEYIRYKQGHEETGQASFEPAPDNKSLSSFTPSTYVLDSTPSVREYIQRRDGVPLPKDLGFRRFERREREKNNPYTKIAPEMKTTSMLFLDDRVQNKLSSDSLFLDVIMSIELFLRDFARSYSEAVFNISVTNDPQIPTWEKVVVTLTLPSLDMGEKMRIWDDVDVKLRKALRKISQWSDPSSRQEIEDISKRLFTHVTL